MSQLLWTFLVCKLVFAGVLEIVVFLRVSQLVWGGGLGKLGDKETDHILM